jgi:hypothetical protein
LVLVGYDVPSNAINVGFGKSRLMAFLYFYGVVASKAGLPGAQSSTSVPSPLANLRRTRHHVMNVTLANGRMSNASFCTTISPSAT